MVFPLARALARAFVFFGESPSVTYSAYLDEFSRIGPYASKQHPKHNDNTYMLLLQLCGLQMIGLNL